MIQYLIKIEADGRAAVREVDVTGQAMEKMEQRAAMAEGGIRRMVSAFAGLFGIDAVIRGITSSLGEFGRIADEAKRAGVSAEQFQAWAFAARKSGVETSALLTGRRTLAVQQTDALANPEGEAARAFAAVGVQRAALEQLGSEQLLDLISQLTPGLPSQGAAGSAVIANLRTLLGREADGLAAAFRDGFSQNVAKARELGLVLPERDVALLDEADDQIAAANLYRKVLQARAIAEASRASTAPNTVVFGAAGAGVAVSIRPGRTNLDDVNRNLERISDLIDTKL